MCDQAARQRSSADARSQQLTVTADTSVVVRGSAIQLQQIMRNLLDNAIKYTPIGGQIHCTCAVRPAAGEAMPAAEPGAEEPTPCAWAVIEVADNGIGVAAEAIPLLFERFYRVQGEGEIPGTGLGLPIARELALLHGGRITLVSAPGEGSTFTIYLPLHEEQHAPQTGEIQEPTS